MKKQLLLLGIGLVSAMSLQAQEAQLSPLKVTGGFNADVVVEALPVADHLVKGVDNGTTGFYVENLFVPNNNGVPSQMPITSRNKNAYYINFEGVNALPLHDVGATGTLVLKTPVKVDKFWVLGISTDGQTTLKVTVNYTDGTASESVNITYGDWWNSNNASYEAFSKLARINRDNGSIDGVGYVHIDEYAVATDAGKSIKSVTFERVSNNNNSTGTVIALSAGEEPIAIESGLTEDVFAEKEPVQETITFSLDGDHNRHALYTDKVGSKTLTRGGLSADGLITSKSGVSYRMDYTALNAARLGSDSRTLTITVAGSPKCEKVYFLGACGNGPQNVKVVVNYSDGTTSEGQFTLKDWWRATPEGDEAVYGLARFDGGNFDERYQFRLYEGEVPADKEKGIQSFTLSATGGTPVIMGVSGYTYGLSPFFGTELGNGTFYLYNVPTGKWLQNNTLNINEWTTRAALEGRGFDVKVSQINGGYQLDPRFGHNNSINGFNNPLYMDTGDPVTTWTISPVETASNNTYTITSGNAKLCTDANGNLAYNTDGWNANLNNTWQLVSRAERIGALAKATFDNPLDATWLIEGPDFANQDLRWDTWVKESTGGALARGGDSYSHGNMSVENWSSKNLNFFQELTNIPNGTYQLTVQGFYRDGHEIEIGQKHNEGNETLRADYFANDGRNPLMSIVAGGSDVQIPEAYAIAQGGKYIPGNSDGRTNAHAAASKCFFLGGYSNEPITFVVTDGTLKFGVRKATNNDVEDDWTLFDNFKLTYLGAEYDAAAVKANLEDALARSENSANASPALAAAIAAGKAALESGDVEAQAQAAKLINQLYFDIIRTGETLGYLYSTIALSEEENVNDLTTFTEVIEKAKEVAESSADKATVEKMLNELRIARKVNAADKQFDLFDGNKPAAGFFYLFNVGQQRFFCGGDDWGAHAAVGFPGIPVELIAAGDGFIINTHLNNGGENEYLNYGGYCDTGGRDVWVFNQVDDGGYVIARANDVTALLGFTHGTYCRVDTDRKGEANPDNQWKLVTKEDRDALLATANEYGPVDCSYLIGMPGFSQREVDVWTHNNGGIFGRGENRPDFCYECWNANPFDLNQTITGLTNGHYLVHVQGYYRDGNRENHASIVARGGEPARAAYLHANENSVLLPTIHSEVNKAPGLGWMSEVGEYPDACSQACDYFENGLYKVTVPVEVTNGTLKISVTKDRQQEADWVVVDNFRLQYRGTEIGGITGIEDVVKENANAPIYNLNGVQVKSANERGIYIQNGKKFVVK